MTWNESNVDETSFRYDVSRKIALDATPGNERFFAVWAARPFALDPALFAGLRTGAALHGVATAGVTLGKIVTP